MRTTDSVHRDGSARPSTNFGNDLGGKTFFASELQVSSLQFETVALRFRWEAIFGGLECEQELGP